MVRFEVQSRKVCVAHVGAAAIQNCIILHSRHSRMFKYRQRGNLMRIHNCVMSKGGSIGCRILPTRLDTRWGGPSWCITVRK